MPGPQPGTFARNQRCLEEVGMRWSELHVLVAVYAHEKAFDLAATRVDLLAFVPNNCDFGDAAAPIARLQMLQLIERHETSRGVGYRCTTRGRGKVVGLLGRAARAQGAAE
jgi:hypothetical protein